MANPMHIIITFLTNGKFSMTVGIRLTGNDHSLVRPCRPLVDMTWTLTVSRPFQFFIANNNVIISN